MKKLFIYGALAKMLSACTGTSHPTYTLTVLNEANGSSKLYSVECRGAFDSSETCIRVAKQICHDTDFVLLGSEDGLKHDGTVRQDPRNLVFTCKAPEAMVQHQESTVAPPGPVVPVDFTLTGDTYFKTGSAELNTSAKSELQNLVARVRGQTVHKVVIIGYTDSTGPAAFNQQLSVSRAQSVRNYLMDEGLQAEYVVEGRGEREPVASNGTPEGRSKNRRVTMHVS